MTELFARNYNVFLIVAVVLSFALAGYFIEKKKGETKKVKEKTELEKEIENFESITDPNMTLGDAMQKTEVQDLGPVEPVETEPIVLSVEPPTEQNPDSDIDHQDDVNKMIIDEPGS